MKENNRGITLIALIVTITILIILSVLTIDFAIKGGWTDRAQDTISKANNQTLSSIEGENSSYSLWDFLPGRPIKGGIGEINSTPDNTTGDENTIGGDNTTGEDPTPTVELEISKNELTASDTSSITITANAQATQGTPQSLTYKLYICTEESGTYTNSYTSSATAPGTDVTLPASGLNSYQYYYWYVVVTDGNGASKTSDKQRTRTFCPGTGLTCTTSQCTGTPKTCTKCTDGQITKTCNGPFTSEGEDGYVMKIACSHGYTQTHTYTENCTTCGGTGTVNFPCSHYQYSSHRYCPHYPTTTTLTTHSYCSHGKTGQHND